MSASRTGIVILAVASVIAGCGSEKASESDAPPRATTPAPESTAPAPTAKDRKRAKALRAWFKEQQMTPSDLYAAGVDAPESMLKVYSIKTVGVQGSTVTLKTDLFPKSDNENEFAGACNQVIAGYLDTDWITRVEVLGADGERHGLFVDEDKDGTDDDSGFTACQSDV